MQIPEGKSNLSNKEADSVFIKATFFTEVIEKSAASYVAHKEVYPELVLKDIIHRKHEWMLSLKEYVLLILSVLYLLLVNDYVFIDSFHCIQLASVLVNNKKNLAK